MRREILFLLLLLCSVASVSAIGVTACNARYEAYEPYAEYAFSHNVINVPDYTVSVEGVWADYIEFERDGHTVSGTLTAPPDWDRPGRMDTFIVFREVAPERSGTAVALAAIRCPIYVRVPYPGEYLEFDMTVQSIEEGETATASTFIGSRGDDPVDDARLRISIEKNGTTLSTFSERLRTIQPREEIRDTVELTTEDLRSGIYQVIGLLSYATEDIEVTRQLRVGSLDIEVINHTKRVPLDDFTRLNFTIENLWNNPVEEVFIRYRISNAQQTFATVTTETFGLAPFEVKELRSIAETPTPLEGTSFIEYTIFFDGNEKGGTLPLVFERAGPDLSLLIFVLIGVLLTIMVVIATVLLRKRDKPATKSSKK